MATNYPGSPPGTGFDVFTVPSDPEDTSLSQAGDSTRNHPELEADLGLAVEGVQHWATLRTHDHSGDGTAVATGKRLSQANTHDNPDTDLGSTSVHHTLGTGVHQAAAGNHVHSYGSLSGAPFVICTSSTRPGSPFEGMFIFETDTNFARVWCDVNGVTGWHVAPLMAVPICRVQQGAAQQIAQGGTVLHWNTVLEDNNGFTAGGSPFTDLTIHDGGLYHVDAAVQWDTTYVPDHCDVYVTNNGVVTQLRESRFQRGEQFIPGFSQTISLSGKHRFASNDVVRLMSSFSASEGLVGLIFTFFESLVGLNENAVIASHLELSYLAP